MKFSTTAAAALLAATATAQLQAEQKRATSDVVANLEQLYTIATRGVPLEKRDEINQVVNQHLKRELEGTVFADMVRRDDIDWSSIINTVLQYVPTILKAVWDSGIIQSIVSSLLNSQAFKDGLYNALKWVVDLILGWFTPSTTSTSTVGATATGSPQQKRDNSAEAMMHVKRLMNMLEDDSDLTVRDLTDTIGTIVASLWNNIAQWLKDHPEQFAQALQKITEFAYQIVGKVYVWARDNGYIDKAFQWLGENLGDIIQQIILWITSAIGGQSPDPKPSPSSPPAPSDPVTITSTLIGSTPTTVTEVPITTTKQPNGLSNNNNTKRMLY